MINSPPSSARCWASYHSCPQFWGQPTSRDHSGLIIDCSKCSLSFRCLHPSSWVKSPFFGYPTHSSFIVHPSYNFPSIIIISPPPLPTFTTMNTPNTMVSAGLPQPQAFVSTALHQCYPPHHLHPQPQSLLLSNQEVSPQEGFPQLVSMQGGIVQVW